MTTELPMVTIAMPCLDEERFIETCVRSVLAQEYPKDRIEMLVADGMSTDATRDILARLAAEDPRIRIIDNPERLQAAGMNRIIAEARGDVVIRMDVHCEYANDYVRMCVAVLERTGADNVGGAQRARSTTFFQRALCAALTSPLGVGGAKYRSAESEGFVDTVFLGAFRRRVFETVGLYDPGAITNEDAELNQRILAAGGKVYLSPGHRRALPPARVAARPRQAVLQVRQGARAHAAEAQEAPLASTGDPVSDGDRGERATRDERRAAAHPVRLRRLCRRDRRRRRSASAAGAGVAAIPVVWAIFPVLHVSHGVGFAVGLVRYGLVERDWLSADGVSVPSCSRAGHR